MSRIKALEPTEDCPMKLRITHETHYDYTPMVVTAQHVAHLEPVNTPCQTILAHTFATQPQAHKISCNFDVFGNQRCYWSLPAPHHTLHVNAQTTLETYPLLNRHQSDLQTLAETLSWEQVQRAYQFQAGQASDEATAFVYASYHAPIDVAFKRYAQSSFSPNRSLLEAVRELMQRIHTDFMYESFSTDISTPALTVLSAKRGVCQDFAHVMLACLRSMGLAARYVSGYLLTEPPPGQARLIGSDASHAWISLRIPNPDTSKTTETWYDFDPTNNRAGWCSPGPDYVRLAVGRDFADVSPLRGVLQGGASHTLQVNVTVEPL
jgi:transglutaminase-like putative cysteine protease